MRLSGLREDTSWLQTLQHIDNTCSQTPGAPTVEYAHPETPLLLIPSPSGSFDVDAHWEGITHEEQVDAFNLLRATPVKFCSLYLESGQHYLSGEAYDAKAHAPLFDLYPMPAGVIPTHVFVLYSRATEVTVQVNFGMVGTSADGIPRIAAKLHRAHNLSTGEWMSRRKIISRIKEVEGVVDIDTLDDEVEGNMHAAVGRVACFLHWAETHDMYSVITKREKPDNKKPKHAYKRRDLPRLIYINRMPSERPTHHGGTHASPRGHERRGHYRTLRAPCFRNHPKFMQKNATYIKPVWIGPEEVVHEGNRYTLMTS